VVAALGEGHNNFDAAKLAGFLERARASYLFLGTNDENKLEEDRIASRMFRPEEVPPGDPPVPVELWLLRIQAQFKQLTAWSERPDLYRSPGNPDGLDPAVWQAIDATYQTEALFETQGATDYRVSARQNFVVILDLRGMLGPSRGAFLYRWEDLGPAVGGAVIATPVTWTQVKTLYK
jgi:hypothetical protein